MGNHAVGKAFAATFEAIENDIQKMSSEELFKILDAIGNKFYGADAEFHGCDRPIHPLGRVLIKCFCPSLPDCPLLNSDDPTWDAWDEEWYEKVYQPFQIRYGFC